MDLKLQMLKKVPDGLSEQQVRDLRKKLNKELTTCDVPKKYLKKNTKAVVKQARRNSKSSKGAKIAQGVLIGISIPVLVIFILIVSRSQWFQDLKSRNFSTIFVLSLGLFSLFS